MLNSESRERDNLPAPRSRRCGIRVRVASRKRFTACSSRLRQLLPQQQACGVAFARYWAPVSQPFDGPRQFSHTWARREYCFSAGMNRLHDPHTMEEVELRSQELRAQRLRAQQLFFCYARLEREEEPELGTLDDAYWPYYDEERGRRG